MRMKPRKDVAVSPGYLLTALGHPTLGRPLVKALAYGSSIPEIEVSDMLDFSVVRLSREVEAAIGRAAQAAAEARGEADNIERDMSARATEILSARLQ
jgi:hypothetical protein